MKLRDRIKELRCVKASEILPNPANWCTHPRAQQDAVRGILAEVGIAARAMRYSSRPGENILDLLGGSGSTLMAAERTQRRAFLTELDPLYCEVIVQRWEKFTGQKAERIAAEYADP